MPTSQLRDHISYPRESIDRLIREDIQMSGRTYLRRHELGSTAECAGRSAIPHVLLTETIIGNLNVTVQGQENIVKLQVTINDPILVEVLERQADFGSVESEPWLASCLFPVWERDNLLRPL